MTLVWERPTILPGLGWQVKLYDTLALRGDVAAGLSEQECTSNGLQEQSRDIVCLQHELSGSWDRKRLATRPSRETGKKQSGCFHDEQIDRSKEENRSIFCGV